MAYNDPVTDDPMGAKILPAFIGDDNRWRTLGGVARETGLPIQDVQSYINTHRDYFVQSTFTTSGSTLYGLRDEIRNRPPEN